MWLPTKLQVDAASRHAITAASVAFTIFGLQAKGIKMEDVSTLINSLGTVVNTVLQIVAAAGVIYGGLKAANSASPTSQIASVKAIAQDNSAPIAVEAKAALLDAVAAQPEVVGKIGVTDQKLVDATQSTQIQKAA
jgi:hypothetical protein